MLHIQCVPGVCIRHNWAIKLWNEIMWYITDQIFSDTPSVNSTHWRPSVCLSVSSAYLPVGQSLREGDGLVESLPRRPMSQLHRLVFRRATAHWKLPVAQNHREGQLCQSQTGATHPHRQRGKSRTKQLQSVRLFRSAVDRTWTVGSSSSSLVIYSNIFSHETTGLVHFRFYMWLAKFVHSSDIFWIFFFLQIWWTIKHYPYFNGFSNENG